MNIDIRNPINPINPRPMAATFDVVLYSVLSGFLSILQTLPHCAMKDFTLNIVFIED